MPSSPVFFRRTHWLRILLRFIIYLSASCAVCIPPNCSTPGSVCSWASCMSNACRWAGNLCNFWIHLCNFWIHFVTISWVFTPWKGSPLVPVWPYVPRYCFFNRVRFDGAWYLKVWNPDYPWSHDVFIWMHLHPSFPPRLYWGQAGLFLSGICACKAKYFLRHWCQKHHVFPDYVFRILCLFSGP